MQALAGIRRLVVRIKAIKKDDLIPLWELVVRHHNKCHVSRGR
jgi:hypothetical protein